MPENEAAVFILISAFIDETEKYYTNNNRSLDPSEHKKQRFLDSKRSPALFQVITHTKHFFELLERSTAVSSKLATVDALIQNTENASEELSSGIQFSKIKVFSGLFLKSPVFFHIKAHRKKEHT